MRPDRGVGSLSLRALGACALLAFACAGFTSLPNRLYAWICPASSAGNADAIVALGAAVDDAGRLSDHSLRRAVEAVRLQREGRAPLLVLLGNPVAGRPNEAKVRAELARALGVRAEAIVTTGGPTTRAEARAVAALQASRGVRRILLVTSGTHMPRARALFAAAGFEVLPVSVDDAGGHAIRPWERLELTRVVLQELVARAGYAGAGRY